MTVGCHLRSLMGHIICNLYASAGNSGEEQNIKFAQERAEKDAKLQDICQKGFQSCIVGYPTAEPNAIMQAVLPLLAPSASFAIFFPSLQPLAECMDELIVRLLLLIGLHHVLGVCLS